MNAYYLTSADFFMYRTSDPIATEYTRRIAEEAKAKEAERRAQRAADEEQRRLEVAGLPALRSPNRHIDVEPLQLLCQPARAGEKVYELEAPGLPVPPSPQSYHTASTSIDDISAEKCVPETNNDAILTLREDLERERHQIQRLEQEVRHSQHEIASLCSQREADQRQYIQALRARDYEYAAEVHTHLEALHRQLENAWADRRKLENDIEEGRSREEVLRRQLGEARGEAQLLEDQLGVEKKRKVERDGKWMPGSRGRERKAVRKISSKQVGRAIRVEYVEYEIQPKVAGNACCLVM